MTKIHVSYQASAVLYLGQRVNQEDAIATDFAIGDDMGFAVLSDGMGGHNAGEVASRVVVTEVFSELKFRSGRGNTIDGHVRDALLHAADVANACVGDVANEAPEARGMGATLVVPFFNRDELHWISIGDSPLYLHRNGQLRQLNEDHSMGPHIDMMVRSGMLTEHNGRYHPDRNCLTSVLVGRPIARVDCPEVPTHLMNGDIILVASDGVQSLPRQEIEKILERHCDDSSDRIATALLEAIEDRDDPEQDNVSYAVIKVFKSDVTQDFCPKRDVLDEIGTRTGMTVRADPGSLRSHRSNKLQKSLARFLPGTPSTAK
ncbi:MAG: protein phosphatase 2C domain-containing protein [Pseudomonadota bacterium]